MIHKGQCPLDNAELFKLLNAQERKFNKIESHNALDLFWIKVVVQYVSIRSSSTKHELYPTIHVENTVLSCVVNGVQTDCTFRW